MWIRVEVMGEVGLHLVKRFTSHPIFRSRHFQPESGTKRPKMTTPRNRTSSMALSTKLLKLHIF